jgi:2-(1,2-epoxy-1,2-dihydrophenyl)acetyl-CoA isomerase
MGLSWFLPRLMRPGDAADLLLTGRVIDADEAYRLGLVQRPVPAGRAKEEALAYAARLARLPSLAAHATVGALRAALERTLPAQLELEWRNQRDCFASGEVQGRVAALLAREGP